MIEIKVLLYVIVIRDNNLNRSILVNFWTRQDVINIILLMWYENSYILGLNICRRFGFFI